jgi:hypothetical protein
MKALLSTTVMLALSGVASAQAQTVPSMPASGAASSLRDAEAFNDIGNASARSQADRKSVV